MEKLLNYKQNWFENMVIWIVTIGKFPYICVFILSGGKNLRVETPGKTFEASKKKCLEYPPDGVTQAFWEWVH